MTHPCTPAPEAVVAAGIPEAELPQAMPLLNWGVSLTKLVAFYNKYKGMVPQIWEMIKDAKDLFTDTEPGTPSNPSDPFAG